MKGVGVLLIPAPVLSRIAQGHACKPRRVAAVIANPDFHGAPGILIREVAALSLIVGLALETPATASSLQMGKQITATVANKDENSFPQP